jgi:hypothetical protein
VLSRGDGGGGGLSNHWLWYARVVEEVAELVAAGDAELGVGAVQVRDDGAGRQVEPVGDLAVGQTASGEDDDLALLCGEPVKRAGIGRRTLRGYAAGG